VIAPRRIMAAATGGRNDRRGRRPVVGHARPKSPFSPQEALSIDAEIASRGKRASMRSLHIPVTSGLGTGPTALSAFDAALVAAGVANFNLVRLSSVIPPASAIVPSEAPSRPAGSWGDRLYVVYAAWTATGDGEEAWAGIGWVQDPETGAGLFVEHEGPSRAAVEGDITASLDAVQRNRGVTLSPARMVLRGARCEGDPVCALVIATYESTSWRRGDEA
jgi:arginine decarboxylase